MSDDYLGELMTLSLMAFALGMDAFSVCLGLGTKPIRRLRMLQISLLIGLMHVLMPLGGIILGSSLSAHMGQIAAIIGGILLLLFGIHMMVSSIFGDTNDKGIGLFHSLIGLTLFSISVSFDSFSIGISLGLFNVNQYLVILLFGIISCIMTLCGLLLGKHVGAWIGRYAETLGGLILLLFGLKFIL